MTRSLEQSPTRTAPSLDAVAEGKHPGYAEVDAHVDYVKSEAEAYRDLQEPNEALALDLAERAMLLANYLPALQAELVAVDVAASTQHPQVIEIAHRVIDVAYKDRSEEQRARSHMLATNTILLAAKDGVTPETASIQVLVDDAEARGIDFDAPLVETIDPVLRDEQVSQVAHAIMRARNKQQVAKSLNIEADTGAIQTRIDPSELFDD